MPSRLAQRIRTPAPQLSRQYLPVALRSPWMGYCPDLVTHEANPNAVARMVGVVSLNGKLTTPDGWTQVDPTTLPLGHDSTAIGYQNGATTYGAGDLAVSAANAQPIRHIASFQRFVRSSGISNLEALVITGDTGAIGGVNQETGHLFRKTASGNFTSVEFDSKDGDGADVANAKPIEDDLADWIDSIVYPPGVTGGTFANGGDTEIVQAVAESVFVWCSEGADQVMYFPGETGGSYYTDYRSYAQQLTDAAAVALASGGTGQGPAITTFRAKTMASFNDQAWYGNIVENSTHYGVRLRRSKVGNPLIIDENMEIIDGAGTTLNGVGAGAMDLVEFRTPIKRVLVNGDVLTVYSGDGIANIYRAVSATDTIFTPQYVTLRRGLIAPGAVCDLGGGVHFAILSDGWYLIAQDGTFREVGVAQEDSLSRLFGGRTAGSGLSGSVGGAQELLYKWRHDFYENLNGSELYKLRCEYDVEHKQVVIAVPQNGGTAIWRYDIQNDRVWLDDWSSVGGRDESPTAWGLINEQTSIDLIWSADTGVWSDDDGIPWEATDARFGESRLTHGDENGYVYIHQTSLNTRDGQAVDWYIELLRHHYGPAQQLKTLDAVRVEFENNEASIQNATIQATSEEGVESHTVQLAYGSVGEMRVDYAHFRLEGTHFSLRLAGTGRPYLHSLEARFIVAGSDWRRAEGS